MNDDRTCKSEDYWDVENDARLGGQTRPFAFEEDPNLAEAIYRAMNAGACRAAARAQPDRAQAWLAVAECERRRCMDALEAIPGWR